MGVFQQPVAIVHLIGGNGYNSIDPHAITSQILALKLSRNSAGEDNSPPTLKLRRGMEHKMVS
ncbi:MAG: hypothetical protein A2157_08610 [Deltaproteobacteria bacterium RBG_16_47_11]|nr:MAG: hypothetical protein A2157_08610 [Deltaproteobacteria bacterium RBG_16_47_11]